MIGNYKTKTYNQLKEMYEDTILYFCYNKCGYHSFSLNKDFIITEDKRLCKKCADITVFNNKVKTIINE